MTLSTLLDSKGLVKTKKKIETLNWPPFSPDMNPIEHLWDELERRMKKYHPKNKEELKEILLKEWNNIGTDVTEKLVDSVPNRLYECVGILHDTELESFY